MKKKKEEERKEKKRRKKKETDNKACLRQPRRTRTCMHMYGGKAKASILFFLCFA